MCVRCRIDEDVPHRQVWKSPFWDELVACFSVIQENTRLQAQSAHIHHILCQTKYAEIVLFQEKGTRVQAYLETSAERISVLRSEPLPATVFWRAQVTLVVLAPSFDTDTGSPLFIPQLYVYINIWGSQVQDLINYLERTKNTKALDLVFCFFKKVKFNKRKSLDQKLLLSIRHQMSSMHYKILQS